MRRLSMEVFMWRPIVASWCVYGLFISNAISDEPSTGVIGELSNPSRWVFVGSDKFTEEGLRASLAADLDMQLASVPSSTEAELLASLEVRLTEGYQHASYLSVRVQAEITESPRRVLVRIHEGPQFNCGHCEFRVPPEVDVEQLRMWCVDSVETRSLREKCGLRVLNERSPPAPVWFESLADKPALAALHWAELDPVWKSQKQPGRSRVLQSTLEHQVREGLAAQGFFQAEFTVTLDLDDAREKVNALIRVTSAGVPARLGRVIFSGLQKQQRHEILELLDLETGAALTARHVTDIEQRLRACGRFLTSTVKVGAPLEPDDPLSLKIVVRENPHAPLLSELPSDIERTMLRLQHWLNLWSLRQLADEGDQVSLDMVIEFRGRSFIEDRLALNLNRRHHLETVLTARNDYTVRWRSWSLPTSDTVPALPPDELVVASENLDVAYLLPRQRTSYVVQDKSLRFFPRCFMTGHPNPKSDDLNACFFFALPTMNFEDAQRCRKSAILSIDPTVAYVWANHEDWTMNSCEGVLTASSSSASFEVQEESGRLLSHRLKIGSQNEGVWTVSFQPGVFARTVADIRQQTLVCLDDSQVQSSWGAAIHFTLWFVTHSSDWNGDEALADRVFNRLVTSKLFQTLQKSLSSREGPFMPIESQSASQNQWLYRTIALIVGGVLLPRDSSIQSVNRSEAALLMGRTDAAKWSSFKMQEDRAFGPIGYAYAIWLPGSRSPPGPKTAAYMAPWAKAGLGRLDLQRLRDEIAPWFESESPASELLWQAVDHLRTLDDDELQFVAQHLFVLEDEATQQLFREIVCESAEQTPRELATQLIERLWPAAWEQVFRLRFRQITSAVPKVFEPSSSELLKPAAASPSNKNSNKVTQQVFESLLPRDENGKLIVPLQK